MEKYAHLKFSNNEYFSMALDCRMPVENEAQMGLDEVLLATNSQLRLPREEIYMNATVNNRPFLLAQPWSGPEAALRECSFGGTVVFQGSRSRSSEMLETMNMGFVSCPLKWIHVTSDKIAYISPSSPTQAG